MLEKLEEQIKGMLEGEKKRREKALQFLDAVVETLEEFAPDLWGNGDGVEMDAVWITKTKDKKIQRTDLYYRYKPWTVWDNPETAGIYLGYEDLLGGQPIGELRGSIFWWAIRTVIEWLPLVAQTIKNKEESREKLLSLLK